MRFAPAVSLSSAVRLAHEIMLVLNKNKINKVLGEQVSSSCSQK